MDDKRKKGVKMVKARLALIADDEDLTLPARVERLNDEEACTRMIEMMKEFLAVDGEEES
jgi:hypothetical protein